jgi:hypothetical protein
MVAAASSFGPAPPGGSTRLAPWAGFAGGQFGGPELAAGTERAAVVGEPAGLAAVPARPAQTDDLVGGGARRPIPSLNLLIAAGPIPEPHP